MSAKFNHNMCWSCWRAQELQRDGTMRRPVRVVGLDEEELEALCCYCGQINLEGIYVRRSPEQLPCRGQHRAPRLDVGE